MKVNNYFNLNIQITELDGGEHVNGLSLLGILISMISWF